MPDRRRRPAAGAALAAWLTVALAAPAAGGRIAIRTDAACAWRQGALTVDVTLTNRGDEAACNLKVSATLAGRRGVAVPIARLEPGAGGLAVVTLEAPAIRPGEETVVIETRYEDLHGYGASVLTTAPLVTAIPARGPPPPELRMTPVHLNREARLTLALHNPADTARTLRISLFTPLGLRVTDAAPVTRTLAPGARDTVAWTLQRTSALPGSTCSVFAVAEYEEDELLRARTTRARVRVRRDDFAIRRLAAAAPWLIGLLVALALVGPRIGRHPPVWLHRAPPVAGGIALGLTLAYLLYHLPLRLILSDSLIIGGDTPAHNVLAAHLKDQLLQHGRLVSWSNAWWCGFPAFQFYFTLPYTLIALLSVLMPFNIAFKLVSVLGILALPFAAWGAARIARLPRPIAVLLGVAMLALLFDHAHVMWGVNIYSTFAGMIANSLSFPLMLLMLACALRDSDDGRFRIHTVLLMAFMIASHFFTSIVGALCLAVMPLCRPRAGFRRALATLAVEGVLAVLLMSWWLLPLWVRRDYAVDFGTNWPLNLVETIPPFLWVFTGMAAVTTLWLALRWRHWPNALYRFTVLALWMTLVAGALFRWGYRLSPVFVNVRLWPFLVYGLAALAMIGLGKAVAHARWPTPLLLAGVLALLAWGPQRPNPVRAWARWNYGGLEKLPRGGVLHALANAVRDTPGRLANDLHPANDALGSSRIFETMPYLAGKPVLEGGLVNSAWGSLFSYYIQGETSQSTAGFPTMVQPTTFNFTNATRHLALMNVKHFAARWESTRAALHASPDWTPVLKADEWELFENTAIDGRYVTVCRREPIAVRTARRQEAGLEWMYRINAIGQPFILLGAGEPPSPFSGRVLSYEEMIAAMDQLPPASAPVSELYSSAPITTESVTDDTIRFTTTAVGCPHLIKCSYYPRWRVTGADAVYMVTPGFMLVRPTRSEVTLRFANTATEHIAHGLTVVGVLLCVVALFRKRPGR